MKKTSKMAYGGAKKMKTGGMANPNKTAKASPVKYKRGGKK